MRSAAIISACIAAVVSTAQSVVSPITKDTVQVVDSLSSYRFLVSGHWYGAGTSRSGFPASTVQGNIEKFNATGASFFLLTGDIFQNTKSDQARYAPALYDRLRMPLFNAVGNHDLDGGFYNGLFGSTWRQWDVRSDRFIILDTEEDDSSIKGEQLRMIEQAAADAEAGKLKHVFITSHRPIWAEGGHYSFLFPGNTKSIAGCNYEAEVLPLLRRIVKHAEVFWMAGSMGGTAPASILFETPEPNLHYVMSAIRDETRDAVLLAEVSSDSVRWEAISLTGKHIEPVRTYTAEWWREHLANPEGFEWKLLPYHIKSTLLHRNFWIGVGAVSMLWLGFGILRLRRRSG
ncbi:MAG: hypothetical protein IPO17_10815 [Flavobacteriales bacterium]|nr:hypothetical protein [Flavobacteriales bacterium]